VVEYIRQYDYMGELDVLMHVPPSVKFSTWLSVLLYFI
jgi:hypothetical protein